jgi:hypothetical protein
MDLDEYENQNGYSNAQCSKNGNFHNLTVVDKDGNNETADDYVK